MASRECWGRIPFPSRDDSVLVRVDLEGEGSCKRDDRKKEPAGKGEVKESRRLNLVDTQSIVMQACREGERASL